MYTIQSYLNFLLQKDLQHHSELQITKLKRVHLSQFRYQLNVLLSKNEDPPSE